MEEQPIDNPVSWGPQDLDGHGPPAGREIGDLRLWLCRTPQEIKLAFEHKDPTSVRFPTVEPPLAAEWSRWAVDNNAVSFLLGPTFPDVPIVARPESPFFVTRGHSARIYVRVPIWVRIETSQSGSRQMLSEVPTVILSKTWSGTFTEGELAYWIPTSARRQVTPELFQPHLVVCPLQIVNDSEEELRVERLCLRVMYWSIFGVGKQLWSDEIKLSFKGTEATTNIQASGVAPPEVKAARMVTPPRISAEEGFTARTFHRIKDLPGLGIFD